LPVARGRNGLLVIFRVRAQSPAGLAPSDELVPVFAEGACPRLSRRQDLRVRASAGLARLVPQMANAIPPRPPLAVTACGGFDRDAWLTSRARTRQVVQRGLFDRRAEREADQAEAEAAGRRGQDKAPHEACDPDDASAQPPQPVLLLFATS
jgi:hypothetical protein